MDLYNFQKMFVDSITLKNEEYDLVSNIIPVGRLNPQEALYVYQDDYKARMREALGANYEATWRLMGDDNFFDVAEKFIFSHPSKFSNLTFYGDLFPLFLKEVSEEAHQMATFEHAFWKSFHAMDSKPKTISEESFGELSFDLSGLTLIHSQLRLDLIWQYRNSLSNELQDMNLFHESYFALYKREEKVEIERLVKNEYEILMELQKGIRIIDLDIGEVNPKHWMNIFNIIQYMI